MEQAEIPHEVFAATYTAALEACLQGLISPATLGVDLKKTDNAGAQREKEKVTLYTLSRMIEVLSGCLAALASAAVRAASEACGEAMPVVCAEAVFGDYSSPDFDSRVETVSRAMEKGVMSVETAVEELYGDTRSAETALSGISARRWTHGRCFREEGDLVRGSALSCPRADCGGYAVHGLRQEE